MDIQALTVTELLTAREYLQKKVAEYTITKGEAEGHGFRGNRYTGGIPGDGPQVYVRADAAPPGTASYDIQARQPGGAPIRGTVISPTDPRIPNEVYHVTTHYNEVVQSGMLKAGGAGGLGGDDRDHIVSMTISKEVAGDIEHDQKLMATWAQSVPNEPPGQQWDAANSKWLPAPEREVWGKQLTSNMQASARQEGWDFKPINAFGEYSFGDWQVQYFTARESAIGKQNPVFFGAKHSDWASVDPKNIGTIRISKDSLNNGALLTNFDLGQHGLEEIRSYGDVPISSQKAATLNKYAPESEDFSAEWSAEDNCCPGCQDAEDGSPYDNPYNVPDPTEICFSMNGVGKNDAECLCQLTVNDQDEIDAVDFDPNDYDVDKSAMITKGDVPGHEFHGNQWTQGGLLDHMKNIHGFGEGKRPASLKTLIAYHNRSHKLGLSDHKTHTPKSAMITKGEDSGHPFRGNRYTGGIGGTEHGVPVADIRNYDEIESKMGMFGQDGEKEHPERYEDRSGGKGWLSLKDGESITRVGKDANGRPILYDEKHTGPGLKERVNERPLPYTFRTMSEAEWQGAAKNGFIQSNASWNLGSKEGTVTSARHTGTFYMQPGENRIVRIDIKPGDNWRVDTDDYIKTNDRIPFDRVSLVSPKISYVGGGDTSVTFKRAKDAIPTAIESVRPLPHERAIVIDRKGKRVWLKNGGHDFVALKQLEHKDLEGATFIHNHPSGVAPSVDDIGSACALQLGQVYAVGKNGLTYNVKPPPGKETFEPQMWKKIRDTGQSADYAVRQAFAKGIVNGDISVDDANRDHWHMVNTIIALQTGLQYTRTGKGEYHLKEIMATHKGHIPVYDAHGVSKGYPPPEELSKEADVTFSLLYQRQEAQPKQKPTAITNADTDTRR